MYFSCYIYLESTIVIYLSILLFIYLSISIANATGGYSHPPSTEAGRKTKAYSTVIGTRQRQTRAASSAKLAAGVRDGPLWRRDSLYPAYGSPPRPPALHTPAFVCGCFLALCVPVFSLFVSRSVLTSIPDTPIHSHIHTDSFSLSLSLCVFFSSSILHMSRFFFFHILSCHLLVSLSPFFLYAVLLSYYPTSSLISPSHLLITFSLPFILSVSAIHYLSLVFIYKRNHFFVQLQIE